MQHLVERSTGNSWTDQKGGFTATQVVPKAPLLHLAVTYQPTWVFAERRLPHQRALCSRTCGVSDDETEKRLIVLGELLRRDRRDGVDLHPLWGPTLAPKPVAEQTVEPRLVEAYVQILLLGGNDASSWPAAHPSQMLYLSVVDIRSPTCARLTVEDS